MQSDTHYETLEINENATGAQIKEAYRRQAMKWHPDRHDGERAKREAHIRFKRVAEAYRTLKDEQAKAEYDATLAAGRTEHAEHAQQKQSRTNQHESTAHPGPAEGESQQPRAEEDADDALFFEQMLDLAFELVGKGFPEGRVAAALVGLGCPDSMAQAVAAAATKRQGSSPHPKRPESIKLPTTLTELDSWPWDRAEPIYRAVIEGASRQKERIESADYERGLERLNRRKKYCLWGLLGTLAILLAPILLGGIHTQFAEIAVGLSFIFLGLIALYWLGSGVSIWTSSKMRACLRENRTRFYLRHFQRFAMSPMGRMAFTWSLPAFFLNIFWLAHKKMYFHSFVLLSLNVAISWVVTLNTADIFQVWGRLAVVSLLCMFIFSFNGNHLYFHHLRSSIARILTTPTPTRNISNLRAAGRQSGLAVCVIFVASIAASLPHTSYVEDKINQVELRRQQTQADNLAREQATAMVARNSQIAEQDAALSARYDRTLQELEAKYPWTNQDNPAYDSQAVSWVVKRRDAYVAEGQARDAALRLAVSDALQIIEADRQRIILNRGTYKVPSRTEPLKGAQGQSAAEVLCSSLGACER